MMLGPSQLDFGLDLLLAMIEPCRLCDEEAVNSRMSPFSSI